MDIEQLKEFNLETSRRLLLPSLNSDPFTYQQFQYERMAEAAIRNVMTRILEEHNIYYGIEVATIKPYIHSNKGVTRRALVDLVLYDDKKSKNMIYVELKRNVPELDEIRKDIKKMLIDLEYIKGGCFFHYFGKFKPHMTKKEEDTAKKRAPRSIKSIFHKYFDGLRSARIDVLKTDNKFIDRWFALFMLDSSNKECYFSYINNMANDDVIVNNEPFKKV